MLYTIFILLNVQNNPSCWLCIVSSDPSTSENFLRILFKEFLRNFLREDFEYLCNLAFQTLEICRTD